MHTPSRHLALGLAAIGAAAWAGSLPARAYPLPAYGSAIIRNSPCPATPGNPCITVEQGLTDTTAGISPLDTLVISGYAQAQAGAVTLTFTQRSTGEVLYTAASTSIAMAGDYAGYSQFRFATPDYLLGSRADTIDVTVSRSAVAYFGPFRHTLTWRSNAVQVDGLTSHVRLSCHYTPYPTASDGSEYLDGLDIDGHDLRPGAPVSVSLLREQVAPRTGRVQYDPDPADVLPTLWGPVSATTSTAAHPGFVVHVPQAVVSPPGTGYQVRVSYVGREGTYSFPGSDYGTCAPYASADGTPSYVTISKP